MRQINSPFIIFIVFFLFYRNNINAQDIGICKKGFERTQPSLESRNVTSGAIDNANIYFQKCQWAVDPNVLFISGVITSGFIAKSNINSIEFDLHNTLTVSSVEFRGGNIPFTRIGDVLVCDLQTNLIQGQNETISVSYSGAPPNTGFGSFAQTTHGSPAVGIIWTLSEPYGAKDWWPCKQNLNDKIDSVQIEITVPNGNMVASNGLLNNTLSSGGSTTFVYKHNYPIAAYLVAFAVTNYARYTDTYAFGGNAITVDNFVYPESLASFQAGTAALSPVMAYFSNTFGLYPFDNEKYGHTQCGFGGGMEHQTNSFVGNSSLWLLAHELAHQWFGDKVTCASWQDIWLNEGFATYLTALAGELGLPGLGNLWGWKDGANNNITSQTWGSVVVPAIDTLNVSRVFNSRLSYNKGGMALNMIRWKIGDVAFFGAINNYVSDASIAYNYGTTQQLKQYFEAASGISLTEYFNDYVYGEGHPTYTFTWYQDPISKLLSVKVDQIQSHPSVSFFDMKLHLRAQSLGGLAVDDLIFENTANGQIFYFPMTYDVGLLDFDPERNVINARSGLQIIQTFVPLPLKITKFEGYAMGKYNQILAHVESTTDDISQVEIESSTDGIHFNTISSFNPKISPSFLAKDIPISRITYYRLAWKESTSTQKVVSKILTLENKTFKDEQIVLFPNPCLNKINIILPLEVENPILSVYSTEGKLLVKDLRVNAGSNSLDLSALSAGEYIMQVQSKGGSIIERRFYKQ